MAEGNLNLKVKKVIDNEIAPVIESHGGVIDIKSIENGIVTITLSGSCNNCPAAQITTEEIVKEKLLQRLPEEVKDVKLSSEVSEDLWNFAKEILNE
ncbi:NifU family protein [Anaerosphaera multitolerans]|uniref:NifU family protein n=1 Tax=Anaerosphaera multitolerans TaxID=2487351 RepID=A0A437S5G0_9FIRM|nr:NifU family protein [Anaerosphaera multitolerans]RVU54250.1 NifU family protein [Anaerosphaera multitolerans]